MKGILLTVFGVLFLSACASADTVQQAKGTGEKRTFNADYEAVYKATLSTASKQGSSVTSADRNSGQILLSHGMAPWSWGERIVIFLTKISDSQTQVEIISKRVMAPLDFQPQRVTKLFDGIGTELQPHG